MSDDTTQKHLLNSLANPTPATDKAVGEHLDAVQSILARSTLSDQFVVSLAEHYGMEETEVGHLLQVHFGGIMWHLTNRKRKATKSDFLALLRTLNTRLDRLARRLEDRVDETEEAIRNAKLLQTECAKVVTQLRQARSSRATSKQI